VSWLEAVFYPDPIKRFERFERLERLERIFAEKK
jgi:hypothetical protein